MPSCLPTCQVPEPSCTPHPFCIPGCGCPNEMVYDETKQQCIQRTSCGKLMDHVIVQLVCYCLDTCSLPVNTGPCFGEFPRWFHNSTSGQCELFLYGGCGGNSNQFVSLKDCLEYCGIYIAQSLLYFVVYNSVLQ